MLQKLDMNKMKWIDPQMNMNWLETLNLSMKLTYHLNEIWIEFALKEGILKG